MKDSKSGAKASLIASMLIFGTIGIFRHYIPCSSGFIAFVRGLVGTATLALVLLIGKRKPDFAGIRKNALKLFFSGAFLGFNWIFLFEAYKYTTVAAATLCYYMAPVLIILLSPVLFKEKLTLRRGLCAAVSTLGMVIISGVFGGGFSGLRGILLALCAACMYAALVLINKKITGLDGLDRTITQLFISAAVLLPYLLLTEKGIPQADGKTVALLLIVGVVHTGLAYALYFGSIARVKVQTAAIFGYVDPAVAILLSALILKEPLTLLTAVGAVLILGSALISELPDKKA